MDIKVLLCNCKGLCDPFKAADMNTLPFAVESDLDVQYSVLHPRLCGQGGNAILADVFKSAGPDPYVLIDDEYCAGDSSGPHFQQPSEVMGRLVGIQSMCALAEDSPRSIRTLHIPSTQLGPYCGDARPPHEWDAISLPTRAGSHRGRADARAICGRIMATLASAFFTPGLYAPFVGRSGDAALAARSRSRKC